MIERYIRLKKDENKQITITQPGEYTYFFLIAGGSADIDIRVCAEHTRVKTAALLISPDEKTQSAIQFSLTLDASNTRGDVSLVSFLQDNMESHIDGKITLSPGIEQTEGYLTEEIYILGKNVKIKTSPKLYVGAKNVKASHGACIERLQPEKLFYMRSKGLSLDISRALLISSYIQKTLRYVGIEDEKLLEEIKSLLNIL